MSISESIMVDAKRINWQIQGILVQLVQFVHLLRLAETALITSTNVSVI